MKDFIKYGIISSIIFTIVGVLRFLFWNGAPWSIIVFAIIGFILPYFLALALWVFVVPEDFCGVVKELIRGKKRNMQNKDIDDTPIHPSYF